MESGGFIEVIASSLLVAPFTASRLRFDLSQAL